MGVGAAVVGAAVEGAAVVGAMGVGAEVVGPAVVGPAVVGAIVVGAEVVGAAVVGPAVVGAVVVGAMLVGAEVVGAAVVGAAVVGTMVVGDGVDVIISQFTTVFPGLNTVLSSQGVSPKTVSALKGVTPGGITTDIMEVPKKSRSADKFQLAVDLEFEDIKWCITKCFIENLRDTLRNHNGHNGSIMKCPGAD